MIKYPVDRYRVYDTDGIFLRFEEVINNPRPGELWLDMDMGNSHPWCGYRYCETLNAVEGGSFRSEQLARDYVNRREY